MILSTQKGVVAKCGMIARSYRCETGESDTTRFGGWLEDKNAVVHRAGRSIEAEAIRDGAALRRCCRLVARHLAAFGVRRGGGALRGDDPRLRAPHGSRGARARQRRGEQR